MKRGEKKKLKREQKKIIYKPIVDMAWASRSPDSHISFCKDKKF